MIKELAKVANHLDQIGLTKEADLLDKIIYKISQDNFKSNSILKTALVISDPKNPAKKVEITDQQILSAMAEVGNKVPPEFSSWLTNGVGGKTARNFFATSLWGDSGFKYLGTLQPDGTALKFYLMLINGLKDFPPNDTTSRGGQIRYNLEKRQADKPMYKPNNLAEKFDKTVTDVVANVLPTIDTGDENLNKALTKTPAENWRELPSGAKKEIDNIMTAISYIPVLGSFANGFSLATHIYEGSWSLVALDITSFVIQLLLLDKLATVLAPLRSTVPKGAKLMKELTDPKKMALVVEVGYNTFVSEVSGIIKSLRGMDKPGPWVAGLISVLTGTMRDREKIKKHFLSEITERLPGLIMP